MKLGARRHTVSAQLSSDRQFLCKMKAFFIFVALSVIHSTRAEDGFLPDTITEVIKIISRARHKTCYCYISADGIEVQINSNLSHVKDDKGTHFKLVAPNYKYDITTTKIDLKNLFDGNKQLAETTLKFANENWRQLMDDLAPPAIKQIVKTIIKSINKFFSKVTIQQIIHGYDEKH
nr:uncharacterized protein LOC116766412 [Danaus plexippus plexippus]